MNVTVKWLLILAAVTIYAQDPRKRSPVHGDRYTYSGDLVDVNGEESDVSCSSRSCLKRSAVAAGVQDDLGPFWANRGKKDPTFAAGGRLFADEPHWILVRRDYREVANEADPLFYAKDGGVKDAAEEDDNDNAFLANRGKKTRSRKITQ